MKPADFFVGAMDFFAILLPGALLTFLLLPLEPRLFGPVLPALDGSAARWVAFAVGAYFFGHLLHHAGSVLDTLYDRDYAARRRRFDDDHLLEQARRLALDDLKVDAERLNVFKWAGAYVRANNGAAAAELERAGGDSKFFRSLCLVGAVAAALLLLRGQPAAAAVAVLLAVFSYRRFCQQRWEAAQQTYQYFVLLRQRPPSAQPAPPTSPPTSPATQSA